MPALARFGNGSVRAFRGGLERSVELFKPTSFSLVDVVISNTRYITIPSTARAGDVAVLWDGANDNSLPSSVYQSDWVLISDLKGKKNVRSIHQVTVLKESDLGSTLTGMLVNAGIMDKVLLIYRPNSQVSDILMAAPVSADASGSSTRSQTINLSGVGSWPLTTYIPPVIAIASWCNSLNDTPDTATWTTVPPMSGTYSPSIHGMLGSSVLSSDQTPYGNYTVNMGGGGSDNNLQSYALVPASAHSIDYRTASCNLTENKLDFDLSPLAVPGDFGIAIMGNDLSNTNGSWDASQLGTEAGTVAGPMQMRIDTGVMDRTSYSYTFSPTDSKGNPTNNTRLSGVLLAFRKTKLDMVGNVGSSGVGISLTVPNFTPSAGATVYLTVFNTASGETWPNIAGWTGVAQYSGTQGPCFRIYRYNYRATGSAISSVNIGVTGSVGRSVGRMFSLTHSD